MRTEGIILAAGLSSRIDSFKMTLDIGGKIVLERCIESMYDYCERIIIVGGYKFEEIKPIAMNYHKVDLIFNKNYNQGMLSSVKLAFRNLHEERFFFTPGDYALINKIVYKLLIEEDDDIIIPTYKGIKGHPIIMSTFIAKQFLCDNRNLILRDVIEIVGYKTVEVHDDGILIDIDTEEDYKLVLDKAKNMVNYD